MEESNKVERNEAERGQELRCQPSEQSCIVPVADDNSTADAPITPASAALEENDLHNNDIDSKSVSSHTGSENSEDNLSEELQQGSRILRELMLECNKSWNWPFMWPVDDSHPETQNYYEVIKKPMCLNKMKEKFDNGEYETITQFVADFRLMLENCYRYNGPDHFVSKRAQKLETLMEQKLTLLPRDLREKTSISATTGELQDDRSSFPSSGTRRRSRAIVPHDSTALLNQLREQEKQKMKEIKKQQKEDRKRQQEEYHQQMLDWEDKIMEGKGQEMKAMWELPQIGLFLFLCQIPLNIGEVSQFELERCFYMPRESSALQRVMTALLSTPFQRTKIGKKWVMPYKVWEEKLREKSRIWYKLYHDSGRDTTKVAEKLGLDPMFFSVVGQRNPLEKQEFHEISVYKRVWFVKSLCDFCLETQESLQMTMDAQPEEELRDYRLGVDADGNTYIHFPQFCGADLRIYRQSYIPEPKWERVEPELPSQKRKASVSSEEEEIETPVRNKKVKKPATSRKKKKKNKSTAVEDPFVPFSRPSHLRQTIRTVLPVPVCEESDDSDDDNTDDSSDDNDTISKSDSTVNDSSSVCDNTPDSRTKLPNKHLSRLTESDNYSDTSSVDGDIFVGRRLRSSRLLKFEEESSRDSEFLSRSRRLTTRKTRSSIRKAFDEMTDRGSDVGDSGSLTNERTSGRGKGRGRSQLSSVSSENGTDVSSALQFDGENSIDTDSTRVTPTFKKKSSENDEYSSDETMEGGYSQEEGKCEQKKGGATPDSTENRDLIVNNSNTKDEECCESSNSNCDNLLHEKGDSGETRVTCQSCERLRSEHMSSPKFGGGDNLFCYMHSSVHVPLLNGSVGPVKRKYGHETSDISDNDSNSGKQNYLSVSTCRSRQKNADGSIGTSDNGQLVHGSTKNVAKVQNNDHNDVHELCDSKMEEENVKCNGIKLEMPDSNTATSDCHSDGEKQICDTLNIPVNSNDRTETDSELTQNRDDLSMMNKMTERENESTNELNHVNTPDATEIKHEILNHGKTSVENSNLKEEITVGILDEESDHLQKVNHGNINKTEQDGDQKVTTEMEQEREEKDSLNVTSRKEGMMSGMEKDGNKEEELKEEVKKEEPEEENDEEEEGLVMGPEIGSFELIVENVEELRKLVEQFSPPDIEASPAKSKRQKLMKPPPRKRCVVALHERLLFLLKELEPWEYKLCQAAKRARIKMKKEQESWKDSEEANWESEKSEQSGSETEDADTDGEDKEGGSEEDNKSSVNNPEEAMEPFLNEDGCLDVSSRGRIRKRRIIPNNVEDTAKKRKTIVTTTSSTTVAMETVSGTKATMSISTVKPGQIIASGPGMSSQILLQSSDGKKTLVTGLTPQQLSSLRFVKPGTNIIQQVIAARGPQPSALQGGAPGATVKASPRILTTKQASHPVMQQLLSARQPGARITYAPTSGESSNVVQATPQVLTNLNPAAIRPTNQGKTPTQYYAANVSSLPPAVLQQLLKSNSAKLLPGATQTSGMVLLSAVVPQSSTANTGQTLMLNLTGSQSAALTGSVQKPTQSVVLQTQPGVSPPKIVVPQSQGLLTVSQPQVMTSVRPPTIVYHTQLKSSLTQPGSASEQTVILSPTAGTVAGKIVHPLEPANSATPKIVLSPTGTPLNSSDVQKLVIQQTQIKTPPQSIQTFKVINPSLNQIILAKSDVGKVTKPAESTVLTSASTAQNTLYVNTTDESEKNLKIVSELANSGSPNVAKAIPSQPVIQMSPNKMLVGSVGNQQKYASNVTVKTLLEIRKENDKGTAPPTSFVGISDNQTIPVTSSCLVLNPGANISVPGASGGTQIPAANKSTLIIQSTASGIKTLKIPSKAALDSAVQAVVTEVKTSLPTAHIKVPSPTTMPSIQPRKNVTKTIQSMKLPIPTAPTVESKTPKSDVVGSTPVAVVRQSGPVICGLQQNIQQKLPVNPLVVKSSINDKPQVQTSGNVPLKLAGATDQRNVMLNVIPNSKSLEQGVVQGYLTPQGIIIPHGGIQQQVGGKKQIIMSPQGLLLPTTQIQQTSQAVTPTCTSASITKSVAKPFQVIAQSPGHVVPSGTAAVTTLCSKSTSMKTNQKAQKEYGASKLYSGVSASEKSQIIIPSAIKQASANPAASIVGKANMTISQPTLISPLQANKQAVQSSSAHLPLLTTQTSPGVQKFVLQSHQVRGNVGHIHNPIASQIIQSPAQLTSPVVGQISSNTALLGPLKSPIVGQQVMGYVGNTHIIPQSSLSLVNTPHGLAQVIHQPQLSTASLNQSVLSTVINQQNKGSNERPNSAGHTHTVIQPGMIIGSVSTSLANQGQVTQIKPGQAIVGQGSSSELMKQIAAVQQLNIGQQNSVLIPQINQLPQNIGSLQTGNLTNQVLLQLPNLQGQNQVKVQNQAVQGQTMFLLSPKQTSVDQTPSVTTPNKQSPRQMKTPMRALSPIAAKLTAANSVARTSEPSKAQTPRLQLNFDPGRNSPNHLETKPLPTAQPPAKSKSDLVQNQPSTRMVSVAVSGNLPGKAVLPHVNKQVRQTQSDDKSQQQTKVAFQTPESGSQKLFLYNIGGQLVTPQGVPVTVENGVLKVLPKGQCVVSQETLDMMQKSAQLQGLTTTKGEDASVKIKFDVSQKSHMSAGNSTVKTASTASVGSSVTMSTCSIPSTQAPQPRTALQSSPQVIQTLQNVTSTDNNTLQTTLASSVDTPSCPTPESESAPNNLNSFSFVQSLPPMTLHFQNPADFKPGLLTPTALNNSSYTLHFQNPKDFKSGSQLIQQLPKSSGKSGVGPGYYVVRSQRPGLYSYIDSSGLVVTKPVIPEGESDPTDAECDVTQVFPGPVVPVTMYSNIGDSETASVSTKIFPDDNVVVKRRGSGDEGQQQSAYQEKLDKPDASSNQINGDVIQIKKEPEDPVSMNSTPQTQTAQKDKCESDEEAALNLLSLANQSFSS